ncbi:peptidoglycan D,D-transpeptidase FtsI family protein [Brevibacterium album]|uniref:peptidoglycan D,D-transpeptidase FtsI family protein n=1 Tax=Brevibacterium album TaxID=417948 RepID=UPI0003FBF9A1|nr:penicillin-binding protein 2 [Brevibacterium album]
MSRTPARRRRWRLSAKGRIRILAVCSILVLGVVVGNLVAIQGIDTRQAAAQALEGRLVTVALPADRGEIQAADGTLLAGNAARYRLVVDQQNVAGYEKRPPGAPEDAERELVGAWGAAQDLAGPLDTEPGLLFGELEGEARWNVVATGLTSEVREEIDALGIRGITFEEYSIRSYPAGGVAGSLVGFVGSDGAALAGLELSHDEMLRGTDGEQQYERGLRGERIPLGDSSTTPAEDGTGVRLSIDSTLQHYAQSAAGEAVRKHDAEWGSIVIMDVRTGRLLAAAESPSVDPNDPGGVDAVDRGSRVFSAAFEPGSTAKMVTVAGLVEEGLAGPEDEFVVPDKWKASNDEEFRDSSPHEDQNLTLAGILAESSNTGTLMAGEKLTPAQRHEYLDRFGFGRPSGIGFPGENSGILHPVEEWDGRTAYTVMFGQGMSANAIQTTAAMAAIGNGGVLPEPQLVDGTVDSAGRYTPARREPGRRVVSEDTAATVLDMLEHVVVDGTAGNAEIGGYRAAGKTGTAQAPSDTGGYEGYTASFVGVAPVDDPRIAVSVTLQRPTEGYYGGTSAAPVFSDVAGFALRHLHVPPSTGKPSDTRVEWED